MKTINIIYLTIVIFLMTCTVIYSQNDTSLVYYTDDILIYYNNGFIENLSSVSKEKTMIPDSRSISDIKKIRFLSDSLISVSNDKNNDLKIKINKINAVSYKNGSYTGAGIGLGILGGIIFGAIIGSLAEPQSWNGMDGIYTGAGAILGIPIGGIIGGFIGASISSYDIYGINGNRYELEKIISGYRGEKQEKID